MAIIFLLRVRRHLFDDGLTAFSLLRSFGSTSPLLVSFRCRKIFVRSTFLISSSPLSLISLLSLICDVCLIMYGCVGLCANVCYHLCVSVCCLFLFYATPCARQWWRNSSGKTKFVEGAIDSRMNERDRVPESRCDRTSLPFCYFPRWISSWPSSCIPLFAALFCFSLFSFCVWIGLCVCLCSCVCSAFIGICYLLLEATVFVDCRAISLSPRKIVPALHSLAPSQQTTFTKRLF